MNNKIAILMVIMLSVGVFAWLVNYGWQNRYGSPETYEVITPKDLLIGYRPEDLALTEADVFAEIWQDIPTIEVDLHHQITEKPWPKVVIPAIQVQAFHNGKDIYFKLLWNDDHPDTTVSVDRFVDGCALAIPLDGQAPVRSIMMGFSSPVNIWQWQADEDTRYWQGKTPTPQSDADFVYPFEDEEILSEIVPELKSAVTDLVAQRAGSLTHKDQQIVQGRGLWRNGSWNVIFKRALTTQNPSQDCQFAGPSRSASFAVWDGDQGDRGSRKSISEWVNLQMESPRPEKSANNHSWAPITQTESRPIPKASWLDKLYSWSPLAAAYGAAPMTESVETEKISKVINITAKRFEYQPNRLIIEKGELVTIRLESLDVTHGLYLDGYGIDLKARPGIVGKATFLADKPGRFSFRCSETCGEFHPYMIGFLEVTPNTRFNVFLGAMTVAFVILSGLVLVRGKQKNGADSHVGTEQ